jgi:hypothetical protein
MRAHDFAVREHEAEISRSRGRTSLITCESGGRFNERRPTRVWLAVIVFTVFALAGCAASEPAPAPLPSAFDRSWSAALGAAQEEGVRIASEDRAAGVIRGVRGEQEVTINLRSQADGSVRIEMSARGPKGSDPGLAGRISRAYDRRMGR